ncbi:MAG: hypothetical protein H6712_06325 [Myxococcales bacterium]|nr:hypothetical protein [Myxococcales bacterium]MCB9713450.1 hypothetical protein [Myxococcales bacterium]
MSWARISFLLLVLSPCGACIGPLAPYAPILTPVAKELAPEPDCSSPQGPQVDAQGRYTGPPAPAQCTMEVSVPLPGRRSR